MKYKLAIFDFDGTLADSFPWFLGVMNGIADKYRFRRIEDHEIEMLRGCDNREIIEHLKLPMWKMPFVARHMRQRMAADIHGISLFPEAVRMLKDLNDKGITSAVVTSNSQANVRAVLGAENEGLIRYYACGARLFGKTAKIRKVVRQSGIPYQQTICIGDEPRDLHAARAAGTAFGVVEWGYANPESFKSLSPEEIFSSMNDIVEKLTR